MDSQTYKQKLLPMLLPRTVYSKGCSTTSSREGWTKVSRFCRPESRPALIFYTTDAATALQAISEATGGPIDDRKMLLENIVVSLTLRRVCGATTDWFVTGCTLQDVSGKSSVLSICIFDLEGLTCPSQRFAGILGARQGDRRVRSLFIQLVRKAHWLLCFPFSLVELLWNDLTHPASSYVGPKHRFRSGDGSGNSLQDPQFGAANTRELYCRGCGFASCS